MKIRNIAIIILYNSQKKILLQHRSEDAERFPGLWGCFGGGIEDGETPLEAARRETKEELGYLLSKPNLILTEEFKGKHHDGTRHFFVEEYNPAQKLVLGEGQNMMWLSFAEARKLKLSGIARENLDHIEDNEIWKK